MCLEERIRCPAVPHCSPQSLQAAMQLVNIQTLAFTAAHASPWRVYLYTHAQQAARSALILGQLLYAGEDEDEDGLSEGPSPRGREEEVKVTLKQRPRDEKALQGFLSILTAVLHTLPFNTH